MPELFFDTKFIAIYGLFFISAYLIGSIPFGLILTKIILKKDIRQSGSGNIGATNALRLGGKKLGLLTFIFDSLKGWAPTSYCYVNYGSQTALIVLLGCVLGHLFPLYLKFKGGKGVATGLAAILAFHPPTGGLLYLTWIIIALLWRYSSLASIMTFVTAPFWSFFFLENVATFRIFFVISILILIKHRDNIKRLIKGDEPKIGKK